jgi:hypothetical protein
MHVQVRLVNLMNISCEHQFAAFAGKGNKLSLPHEAQVL